jgi:hypothetical protein
MIMTYHFGRFYPDDYTIIRYWDSMTDSSTCTNIKIPDRQRVFWGDSYTITITETYSNKCIKSLSRKELRRIQALKKHMEEVEIRRKNPFKFANRIEATIKRPIHLRGKRLDGSKWATKK